MDLSDRNSLSSSGPVVIVGAGITGLTLGYRLSRAGIPIKIIEAAANWGGSLQSETVEGFRLEWGAHTILADEAVFQLIDDLGIGAEVTPPAGNSSNRFVAVRKPDRSLRPAAIPLSVGAAVKSELLSWRGKLRMLLEPVIPRGKDIDSSVHAFFTRRIGREATSALVGAAMSGIYAGDIEQMSARSALPTLWRREQEFGSILRGTLRERNATPKGTPRRRLISFRGGMSTLVTALRNELGPHLSTGIRAVGLREHGSSAELIFDDGRAVTSPLIVLTGSASETANLIEQTSMPLAISLRQIPYAPVGVLHLSWPREAVMHPLNGFGALIPPQLGTALRGALFVSSLFPDRAPKDRVLISCFVGGAPQPAKSDVGDPIVQRQVIAEVAELLECTGDASIVSARYLPAAIPNYPCGHHRLVDEVELFEKNKRVRLIGSWRQGVGVPDRIARAEAAAKEAILLVRPSAAAAATRRSSEAEGRSGLA